MQVYTYDKEARRMCRSYMGDDPKETRMTDRTIILIDEIEESFPVKADFGSLLRKRRAMKKERARIQRIIIGNGRHSAYSVNAKGSTRLVRAYRDATQRKTKVISNRIFRRSQKMNMVVYHQKGTYRKHVSEFIWDIYAID